MPRGQNYCENSVSCGIRKTSPIRRLHSTAMKYSVVVYSSDSEMKGIWKSSHAENIKDYFLSTVFAFSLNVPPRVLKDCYRLMLAVGAKDISTLLCSNGDSRTDDLLLHFLRGFLNANRCFAHANISNGSWYSEYGLSSRKPS